MSLSTQFLASIRGFVRDKNGGALRAWLHVGADAPAQYFQLGQELRTGFRGDAAIAGLVEKCLPTDEDYDEASGVGVAWPGFVSFVKDFLLYWRDVDFADLPALHVLLSSLLTSCATAFAHPTHGALMLEVSVAVSEALAKLVMLLHHRPDLMLRLRSAGKGGSGGGGGGGDEERKSLVESTADAIQKLFTTCLTDRSSTRWSAPAGKKVAVYRFANLVLKLLFAGNKARWAAQMFTNIASSGPPLHLYPAAQRVTYLYYLGRFYLENNDYARAARCLEAAYRQMPPAAAAATAPLPMATKKHRRLLLTFLIPANLLLGRFPSEALLLRPEAADQLRPVYRPLVAAVRRGHFAGVQAVLHAHAAWLARQGLLVTLTYRLRPLVWRALARRVFLLTYRPPPPPLTTAAAAYNNDTARRAAPTLDLTDLLVAATFSQHQLEGYIPASSAARGVPTPSLRARAPHTNTLFLRAVSGATAAAAAAAADNSESTLVPPPGGPRRLRPSEGLVWGNLAVTAADVESVVAALAAQGLLHGFVAHAAGKFAVIGAKQKGSAVRAGWPVVAEVIRERLREEGVDLDNVPAWVQTP